MFGIAVPNALMVVPTPKIELNRSIGAVSPVPRDREHRAGEDATESAGQDDPDDRSRAADAERLGNIALLKQFIALTKAEHGKGGALQFAPLPPVVAAADTKAVNGL
jgi:hypothetical protein